MNRRQRKEFLIEMRVKAKVAVAMPPREQPIIREKKIGRNEKCPCDSGLKFKYCCINKTKNEEVTAEQS
jgi:uncharacterized protein YecA (UPF0149 family)